MPSRFCCQPLMTRHCEPRFPRHCEPARTLAWHPKGISFGHNPVFSGVDHRKQSVILSERSEPKDLRTDLCNSLPDRSVDSTAPFRPFRKKHRQSDSAYSAEGSGDLHEGYSSEERRIWICPQCFEEFKERFAWNVKRT